MSSSFRRTFSWACFDFANSAHSTLILTFVYNTYFAKALAPSESDGTRLWGNAVAVASVAIALLSPALGAVADAYGWKKRFMTATIALACGATAALYFPVKGETTSALWFFAVSLVATELSIVFNNAFLPEIAPKERHGKVSGLAFALGYAGGLLCLFIGLIGFLPESPKPIWFGLARDGGQNVRATCGLAAVWFAVFSIPMLLWVKERRSPKPSDGIHVIVRRSFARLGETFRHLRDYKQLFWLLVARLFYNDGLVTIFTFGGIYATVEFGFTFADLMRFGIALNVCSMLGAFAFSFIEDRIGSRTTILLSLLFLAGATVAALFVETKSAFWACAIAIGLFLGPNQSASRAYLSRLTPQEKANEFFGFFAFSGKATAFMGPLLYGQMTGAFDSQRAGLAVIPVLLLVGLGIVLWKTKNDVKQIAATAA